MTTLKLQTESLRRDRAFRSLTRALGEPPHAYGLVRGLHRDHRHRAACCWSPVIWFRWGISRWISHLSFEGPDSRRARKVFPAECAMESSAARFSSGWRRWSGFRWECWRVFIFRNTAADRCSASCTGAVYRGRFDWRAKHRRRDTGLRVARRADRTLQRVGRRAGAGVYHDPDCCPDDGRNASRLVPRSYREASVGAAGRDQSARTILTESSFRRRRAA